MNQPKEKISEEDKRKRAALAHQRRARIAHNKMFEEMRRTVKIPSSGQTTALYCRSAVKDDKAIHNQKATLKEYIKRNKIEKYEFYEDNGFSGITLERPALKRLLDDVKNGRIGTIIISAGSVLSRDFEQSKSLERDFEINGVECAVLKKSELEKWYEKEGGGFWEKTGLWENKE